ncbi:hypothetical protein [Bacterioplanoides sp.]|uniref:hypothetical protein n=1 Tax=Bacterioplanoides sp. TaxID=2066072 RepID=UPI003B0088AF
MIKKILLMSLFSMTSHASISDCKNLYVGQILLTETGGLGSVVYMNNRNDTSGSYWSSFVDWEPEAKKAALSVLMAAKFSGHRVNVTTKNADGCGIASGGTRTKNLYLAPNP